MKHTLDEHIELAKAGMLEKGKDPTPGLWLNLFKPETRKFNDRTSINTHTENQNTDNFRNL